MFKASFLNVKIYITDLYCICVNLKDVKCELTPLLRCVKIGILFFTLYTISCFIALSPRSSMPVRACVRACVYVCSTPSASTVCTVKAFSEKPSQHHIQSCRALHEALHYIRNQPNHSASHCVQLRKLLTTMGQVHFSLKHYYREVEN